MEVLLSEKWELQPKHSPEEVLQRWRDLCGVVKNPKRRFRFTANLSKRHEAAEMRRTNQEKLDIAVLVSQAALAFTNGVKLNDYAVPKEVEAAGFKICADELGSIAEGRDLKKLNSHGGVRGIIDKLVTDGANGLPTTDREALNRRREIYGINKFQESKARSFWSFIWEAVLDKTVMISILCALVSLVVGITTEGWPKGAHDGVGIIASILLVVLVRAMRDYRRFRGMDREKEEVSIQVMRNGCLQKMSIHELLPGDVVYLTIGDQVPADGIFLSGSPVWIDESCLTGEREPMMVNVENPFLLLGTKLQDGCCKMLVTTVGMRTQWGKLVATLSEASEELRMNGVATSIRKIALAFGIVTFEILVQKLIGRKWQAGNTFALSEYNALELLEYFAMAAVPEGLPLAVALSLAFATKNKRNNKDEAAVGETTKSNQMAVVKSRICKAPDNAPSVLPRELPQPVVKILLQSIFNNNNNRDEAALLEFCLSHGGDFQAEIERRPACNLIQVDKPMGVVLQLPVGGLRAQTKGASEIILAARDKVLNLKGEEVVPMDEAAVTHLMEAMEQFVAQALRFLANMEIQEPHVAVGRSSGVTLRLVE
ncbi:hypothetical protein C2S51_036084 [Perilla frutescens var. frutescens]|nr:hypothetical protein C2S51_036084 [Perilla frutescens var. frutescens]